MSKPTANEDDPRAQPAAVGAWDNYVDPHPNGDKPRPRDSPATACPASTHLIAGVMLARQPRDRRGGVRVRAPVAVEKRVKGAERLLRASEHHHICQKSSRV